MKIRGRSSGIGLSVAVVLTASVGHASPVMFSFNEGDHAATATFELSGSDLFVTFANVSGADVLVPGDVLTALFFDSSVSLASLTPVSATLASGSSVLFATTQPAGGDVSGEWAWRNDLVGAPGQYGISSVGLDLFGPHERFSFENLFGPDNVNGLEYGITSMGDDPLTGNAPVTGTQPLIQHAVVFHFANAPADFDLLAHLFNVRFQYGTDLSEPMYPMDTVTVIPLPSSMWGGLVLMLGLAASSARKAVRG